MTDDDKYEISSGGQVIGPVTLDLLRRGLEAGKVPKTAIARRVGAATWLPVETVAAEADLAVFSVLPTSVQPNPSTSAMVDPCEVYTGGQTIGPVSLEALRQAVADGKVSKIAVGRRLGSADWKPVAELTGTKFGAAATLAAIRSPWGRLLAAGVGLLGAVLGRYFANLFSSTEPLLQGAAGDYEHTFWRGLRDTGALSQGALVLLICVQGGFFLAYLVTRVVRHTPASVVADVAWIRDWRRSVKAAAALGPFGVLVIAWLGTLVLVPSPGARAFAEAELQERAGRTEWAMGLYQGVASSQPDTALGHRAAQKVQEMSGKLKAQDQAEQAKQRSEQAARTKAAKAARNAELAACKSQRWVSYCELNGVPSGGAFRKSTPDECNKAADDFRSIGMKCADCGCSDNEMDVMMRPAH
jgi:hypothetical protein